VGISDVNVFPGKDASIIEEFREKWGNSFFIEEFISGREFNVSVLGGEMGPQVMPLAEMTFRDYPAGKPRIVGYEAKWKEGTFEYENTERTFDYSPSDNKMRRKMKSMALKCWDIFGLKGYARVDFRVDENNEPFVLEINSNPCMSRDAGLFASCEKAGLSYVEMVQRIIYDAFV